MDNRVLTRSLIGAVGLALSAGVLFGCDNEPDTPGEALERAGENIEDAAENAGDRIDDAADRAGDNIEDAAESAEDAVDDAT